MPAPDEPLGRAPHRASAAAGPCSAPLRPPREGAIGLVLGFRIDREHIPALAERLRRLLERTGAELVLCDTGGLADADAVAVDALARLQLTARRLGGRLRLVRTGEALADLVAFVGLGEVLLLEGEVLPLEAPSGVEAGRQAEQWEQPLRVEEEADPGDGAV